MDKLNTNIILFSALAMTIASISLIGNENFVFATNNNQVQISAVSQISHNYLSNCLSDNGGDGDTKRFEPLGCSEDADNIHVSLTQRSDEYVSGHSDAVNNNMDIGIKNYISDGYGNFVENPDEVGWD